MGKLVIKSFKGQEYPSILFFFPPELFYLKSTSNFQNRRVNIRIEEYYGDSIDSRRLSKSKLFLEE